MSHKVLPLAIHLPKQQTLFFRENEAETRLRQESAKHTMLTAWFDLNANDDFAKTIDYQDIPCHYTWQPATKVWKRRIYRNLGDNTIGRIYSASPMQVELYHLRLLILRTPGATSFEYLRTVNNNPNPCATFRAAAEERGLIMDDSESERCMAEASLYQMPSQLRILFAQIIIFNSPNDICGLWNKFKKYLTEDYLHQGKDEATADGLAMRIIVDQFEQMNIDYSTFGLPAPITAEAIDTFDAQTEMNNGEEMRKSMYTEQQAHYNEILAAVQDATIRDRYFFLEGPGGCGKTYLYKTLIHILRGLNYSVLTVAWTGIAASLLPGGFTATSAFRLPLDIDSASTCTPNGKQRLELMKVDVIIWDEISMTPSFALDAVDKLFQDLKDNCLPFGGITIVCGGDFRQILPVVKRGGRDQIKAICVKNSQSWSHFKKLSLSKNMRLTDSDTVFADWLLHVVGEGSQSDVDEIMIPPELQSNNVIDDIFGKQILTTGTFHDRCILTPLNKRSLDINDDILNRMPGETVTYFSVDVVKSDDPEDQVRYGTETLNQKTPSGLPPHKLHLKVGAPIILLRNLSRRPDDGMCNGTRLIVDKLGKHVITATIITGIAKGKQILLPRIKLESSDIRCPYILSRRQFPVRLAYSMTINKAQGQTFNHVGILLPGPVFTHGQFYVAYSRVRMQSQLKIQVCESSRQGKRGNDVITRNIVYKEIL